MITLTADQKAIASQILKTVFGADYDASQVAGLRTYDNTVEIVTTVGGIWTMGRDYFKQLVKQFKAAAAAQPKRQPQAITQLSYHREALIRMARRNRHYVRWSLKDTTIECRWIDGKDARNWDGSPAPNPGEVALQIMTRRKFSPPRYTNYW